MTIRPILFSAPMVRALLDGRKTQTRRIPTWLRGKGPISELGPSSTQGFDWHFRDKNMRWHDVSNDRLRELLPYDVGDSLWVRESWAATDDGPAFMADHCGDPTGLGWKPSIFMPRRASRLTLRVTDVRIQRLQEISAADALAEGTEPDEPDIHGRDTATSQRQLEHVKYCEAVRPFMRLWNSLNEARGHGWDVNPWVVALTFQVHRCNVGDLK